MTCLSASRRALLASAVWVAAVAGTAWSASAQSVFGDLTGPGGIPDGQVTVGDVGLAKLFALGLAVPTAAQIDAANVSPLLSATGCGPSGTDACIDFANRNGGNGTPGPEDITVGDVGIIQLAALGLLSLPPRLNILSVTPSVGALAGNFPVSINGSGFDLANSDIEVSFTFAEDAAAVSCTLPQGTSVFPVACVDPCGGSFQIDSASTNQITLLTPAGTCHDVSPADGATTATVSVELLASGATATAPSPITYADALFNLEIVSGDAQAGFPLIPLGSPLLVRVTDLLGQPVSSASVLRYVEFEVTSNQSASMNGEGDVVAVDLNADGLASVTVTPYPKPAVPDDLVVQVTLRNFFGDPESGVTPVSFTIQIGASGDLILRHGGGNNQTCAAGEVCPYTGVAAVLIVAELVDRFGDPYTAETATYTFADATTDPALSAASLAGGAGCGGSPPTCMTASGSADATVTAGTLTGADAGRHDLTVQLGGVTPTVLPQVLGTPQIAFLLNVERPVPDDLVATNAAQLERSVDRTGNTGPHAMDLQLFDQFGRAMDGQQVTYTVTQRPTGDNSLLNPDAAPAAVMVSTAGGGLASVTLTVSAGGQPGQLDVVADVPASAPVSGGDQVTFAFAIGTNNPPPPPINLSLVELATPVNNALSAFADGSQITDLLIRGTLGAVVTQAGDSVAAYTVHLDGPGLSLSTPVSNGLPTAVADATAVNEDTGAALDGRSVANEDTLINLDGVLVSGQVVGALSVGEEQFGSATGGSPLSTTPVTPDSVSIDAGGEETFTDNGAGSLIGSGGGTGTVNYATGQWSIDLQNPAAGTGNITASFSSSQKGTTSAYTSVQGIIERPIVPGSVAFDAGGEETFTDNGAGALSGTNGGTGSVNYNTGVWFFFLGHAAFGAGDVLVSYDAGSSAFSDANGQPLQNTPVTPGTVSIDAGGEETFTDNGAGVLSGGGGGSGTINYQTGAWSITLGSVATTQNAILATYDYPGSDPDQGRFILTLSTYLPGTVAELSVADGSGERSLPRTVVLPGNSPGALVRGYASDITSSSIRVFDIDPTDPANTLEAVDADTTVGVQGIRTSGQGPNAVAFFDTDTASASTMDRALVLNIYTHDLSLVRLEEEILSEGADLVLFDPEPSARVRSASSNFLPGRNFGCDGTSALDCDVAPGDTLIVNPGPGEIRRTITAVEQDGSSSDTVLRLAGELSAAQVPGGGVNFQVVSNYREIDADNNPATTSTGADRGVSRIALPVPDPNITGASRPQEQVHGIAVWRPTTGVIPGVEARAYITERTYNGLYVLNMTRNGGTGQWSFAFAATGVAGNTNFFPLPSLRAMTLVSASGISAATGPADIAILPGTLANSYKDAFALVVLDSSATQNDGTGTVHVIALAPDPATPPASTPSYFDDNFRFPEQLSTAPGLATTAVCQGSFPSFVGCEVDLDYNLTTHFRASPSSVATTRFDCQGDGTADDVNGGDFGGTTFATKDRLGSINISGITPVTPRTTNLPGDWWSQQIDSSAVINISTTNGCGAGNNNPDSDYQYRADANLAAITNDFNPYKIVIPEIGVAGVRQDLALVTVRGERTDTNFNVLNEEYQPLYQLELPLGDAPTLSGNISSQNITVPNANAASPYPIACVADLPRLTLATYTLGTDPSQRDPDNYVAYPRTNDLVVQVFDGVTPVDLWGGDGVADSADDLITPGDILISDLGTSFTYHFTTTGLDSSDAEHNAFFIRTDRCDDVPGAANYATFRVMRTAKLVDHAPTAQIKNIQDRDLPLGVGFSAIRTARGASPYVEAFKDIDLLSDGTDFTATVTFSFGTSADPADTTHVGTFDALTCLSDTGVRDALPAGGCAPFTVNQSNDAGSPVVFHLENESATAGGHLLTASGQFGYLLNPQTAEILAFGFQHQAGPPPLEATIYPPLELLGGPGAGTFDTQLDIPAGAAVSFETQNLSEGAPAARALFLNPLHDTAVVIEETGTPVQPRFDDTNNITGFASIEFPMVFDANTGLAVEALDGLVMGDYLSGDMGALVGFVTPSAPVATTGQFLGVVNFTTRAPVDLDEAAAFIQGLDTVGHPFVDFDVDVGRRQLFALIQRSSSLWEIRAWDIDTREEIDLTTEVQNDATGPCQLPSTSVINSRINFFSTDNGSTPPVAIAARDGIVLIGYGGNTGSGVTRLLALDTDNLVTANFKPIPPNPVQCRILPTSSSVQIPINTVSPNQVVDMDIQGDVAFIVGTRSTNNRMLLLDFSPVWFGRGCGTAACLPRDTRNLPFPVTPPSLANTPVRLARNGNLLFVSESRAGTDNVEVFDVTPYDYGGTAPSGANLSDPLPLRAPVRVGKLSSGSGAGKCAGRLRLNGDTLYVVDGRSGTACDDSSDNLHLIDLSAPALDRSTPPDLSVTTVPLGPTADQLRDVVFEPVVPVIP